MCRIRVVNQSQGMLGRLGEESLVAGEVESLEVESLGDLRIQPEKAAVEQANPREVRAMAEKEVVGVAAVEEA